MHDSHTNNISITSINNILSMQKIILKQLRENINNLLSNTNRKLV